MSRSIKVGYLTHAMSHGGATISLLLLQKSIHDKKEFSNATIVGNIPNKEVYEEFIKYNNTIEHVALKYIQNNQVTRTNIIKFFYYRCLSYKKLITIIENHHFDILHINTTVIPQLLKSIKNHLKVNIVTHVRELIVDDLFLVKKNYIISQITKYSDAIIAISDNEARYFKDHPNLHILPNPFDFSSIHYYNNQNIKNDFVKIGMIANLSPSKGNMEFVQTLKFILSNNKTDFKFKFYMIGVDLNYTYPAWKSIIKRLLGKKNYYEKIINYINAYNLSSHIEIVPFTLDILTHLAAFDMLVRPARTADPWGRDIIEAMAMKKPVIATGTSEFYIENNKTGFLVPPKSPEKLADRIVDLINNPEKRILFGQNGYNKIIKMCDIKHYGKKIEEIFLQLATKS